MAPRIFTPVMLSLLALWIDIWVVSNPDFCSFRLFFWRSCKRVEPNAISNCLTIFVYLCLEIVLSIYKVDTFILCSIIVTCCFLKTSFSNHKVFSWEPLTLPHYFLIQVGVLWNLAFPNSITIIAFKSINIEFTPCSIIDYRLHLGSLGSIFR